MSLFSAKNTLPRYITTEKLVGETPLISLERAREKLGLSATIPLAYAGRLDPMASGKLLILIGDECKVQEKYHNFDKEYFVEILLGVESDSGDVLGIVSGSNAKIITAHDACRVLKENVGAIQLPYPHFSSRTVKGKPLHTWALEKKLHEIEIPIKDSRIYKTTYRGLCTLSKQEILKTIRAKIETIPPVTDERKALGADFRRDEVRDAWNKIEGDDQETYQILSFSCIASSGSYMRSLSEKIAKELGTVGLAYSIHRTHIGRYVPIMKNFGFWLRKF